MGKLKEHYSFPNGLDRTREINKLLEEYWLAKIPGRKRYSVINKYMLINDNVYEVKEVVVHEFSMGDVEDPDLYAAEPMMTWEKSPIGQWVMEHALDTPEWFRLADPMTFGYRYQIRAKLTGPALTEWLLRKSA